MSDALDGLLKELSGLTKRLEHIESQSTPRWIYLAAPLTSASWNGNSYSTTAKAVIDLSAVFAVPAGVKAVLLRCFCADSASSNTTGLFILFDSTNTAGQAVMAVRPSGLPNDYKMDKTEIVNCDANGDIYYQIAASGATTMDVWIQIWGYCL